MAQFYKKISLGGGGGGGGGGSGTVTSVSVNTANGFYGTVLNSTTNPSITMKTNVNGMIKGNGTAMSAASAGSDYVAPTGSVSQYIRGDGTFASFPDVTGGGSSVNYYLNGSVNQGTFVGNTYYQASIDANTGAAANFNLTSGSPSIRFITDVGTPNALSIPTGSWVFRIYASLSSNISGHFINASLYKYDGTSFSLISTSANEEITNGTIIDLYTFSVAIPSGTTLSATDRLAIVLNGASLGSETLTVYTQNSKLAQITTTFSTGILSLNNLIAQTQYFATGSSGTDFNISSSSATHTFNIPTSSATNRGLLSTTDWSSFNNRVLRTGDSMTGSLGIGVSAPISLLHVSSVNTTISPSLYTSDYITLSAESTAPGFNIISSGDSVGNRGVFKATRSRNTLSSPTAVQNGDNTFSLVGAGYDGSTNVTTAGITFLVDGAVATSQVPQAITFATGNGASRTERMRINSTGQVGINFVPTSASSPLTVKATAVPSTAESIASFFVTDSSASLNISNAATTDGTFVPSFAFTQATGNVNAASMYQGFITLSDDTGTEPVHIFRAQTQNSGVYAPLTTRPLYQWRNWSTNMMTMLASGNLGIGTTTPGSKLEINGDLKISTIANSSINTNAFLVSDSSVVKYRTGAQVLSDIGAEPTLTKGNLTTTTTGLTITGGTGAVIGSGTTVNIQTANTSQAGLLSSTDWNTFNNKQSTLTLGTLSTSTTGVTVTGGTNAVVGSGATVNIQTATTSQPGLLSAADWTTFNNKQTAPVIPAMTGAEIWRGYTFQNNSTTVTVDNIAAQSTNGSPTARAVATTNQQTKMVRLAIAVSTPAANGVCGMRSSTALWTVGSGFKFETTFAYTDTSLNTGALQFYGMTASTGGITISSTASVSSLLNMIGIGSDAGDTALSIFYNAAGTATKTTLSATDFPANRGASASADIFQFALYNAVGSSSVVYQVTNLTTGVVASGTISSNLPATTTLLCFQAIRTSGASSNACSMDLTKLGCYSLV